MAKPKDHPRVLIYRHTALHDIVDADTVARAWRLARQMVRKYAHVDGCKESTVVDRSARRASVTCGPFRAVFERCVGGVGSNGAFIGQLGGAK